jgi:amino acid transporter
MSTSHPSEPTVRRLRRDALGSGAIVFLVVAAAAPLTVMAGVAPLALAVGGIGAPVGYLAAGAVLTVFAVAFTAMTKHVNAAGAFYAYIARGLGRPAGLAAALLALFSYSTLQIGVYGLLAAQTRQTVADLFGVTVPWPVFAVVGVLLVTAVCWFGIEVGARLLGVLLLAETLILALMSVAVLVRGGAGGLDLTSFQPSAVSGAGMGAVLGICFAAYMGFESTAIYRGEARDPRRTIPRATYISVGFMALFYCFVTWTVVQALGSGQAQQAAGADLSGLFFTVTDEYVGAWAATLMRILVITSVLAAQIAFHNAVTRYALALAGDGVLPRWFSRVHPRHHSPTTTGIAQSTLAIGTVLAFAAAGADPFTGLLVVVNTPGVVGMLVLQLLTAVAVVAFFARRPGGDRRAVPLVAGVVSAVLLAAGTWALSRNIELLTGTQSAWNTALIALVPLVLAVGAVVAAWMRRYRPAVLAAVGHGPDETATDATDVAAVAVRQDPTAATGTAPA